ncbi:hypothetical protein LPB142_05340 [Rhodobacter xanthinilyticus]|uniref:Acyltransferase 3 domain-containing protein n=1 Tax=Rhodobacter xanthinilyticus TaxID=1850250 RepID=A0A1D9MAE7_9RHOB|nr:hypothetical protein LPB142_05340 [Rhodobacter xanthinilyticus]
MVAAAGGGQIALARGDAVNGNLSVSDLFQIYWKPFGQFWFLYAMFFAQLISFLVWRRVRPLLLVFVGLLTFLGAFYALPKTIMLVSYGLFYFFVGMMAREMKLLEHLGRTWPSVVGLLLAGALGAVFCYVAGVPSYLPIPAALFMVPAVLALSIRLGHALAGGRSVALLVTIGQCSMGIFILHILVIGAVRLAMTKFLKVSDPAVLLTVLTLSATLIPVAVQLVAVRLGIDKLVGLPSSVKRGRGVLRKDVVAG